MPPNSSTPNPLPPTDPISTAPWNNPPLQTFNPPIVPTYYPYQHSLAPIPAQVYTYGFVNGHSQNIPPPVSNGGLNIQEFGSNLSSLSQDKMMEEAQDFVPMSDLVNTGTAAPDSLVSEFVI